MEVLWDITQAIEQLLKSNYNIFGYIFPLWEIILIIVGILLLVWILGTIISKYCQKIVARTSKRCHDLNELNTHSDFHLDLQNQYIVEKDLKTKAQFDRFNYDNQFNQYIQQRIEYIKDIIEKAHTNAQLLEKYKCELKEIAPNTTKEEARKNRVPYIIYKLFEEKLVQKNILSPVTEPDFLYQIEYTSPKGRNYYSDEERYSFQQLELHYNSVQKQIERRESKAYQRTLMTESLRYDILKRDGFKCALCGRSADDGVKLHVDHIIPVSKGGKTVPENLRTLCDSCNIGKSDKYDPNGVN